MTDKQLKMRQLGMEASYLAACALHGKAPENPSADLEDLYKEITGQEMPKYYRPPQGIYSQENLKTAQKLGYKTVFWSLAYVDWNNDAQPTRQEALGKLLPRTHPGAVILLHSTSGTNAEILEELIGTWKDEGYEFGTVEELFA